MLFSRRDGAVSFAHLNIPDVRSYMTGPSHIPYCYCQGCRAHLCYCRAPRPLEFGGSSCHGVLHPTHRYIHGLARKATLYVVEAACCIFSVIWLLAYLQGRLTQDAAHVIDKWVRPTKDPISVRETRILDQADRQLLKSVQETRILGQTDR